MDEKTQNEHMHATDKENESGRDRAKQKKK